MFESITVPGYPALPPSTSWNPKVFSKTLENILRYNCVTGYITHRPLADEVLAGKGGTLVLRTKPVVTAKSWRPGLDMVTQKPTGTYREFSPARFLYFQTMVAPHEMHFSDISDWAGLFRDSGLADLIEKKELEFFDYAMESYGITADASGYVGTLSNTYQVGTPTRPVALLEDDAAVAADTHTGAKASATKFFRHLEGVLLETKSEQGLTFGNSNYIVLPTWMAVRRGLSDIKAADVAGTGQSILFRGVDQIPNPGGFSDMYRSNQIAVTTLGAPTVTGEAPTGTKVWPVFYGKVAGVMESSELKIDEQGMSERQPGTWYRHYEQYDWFARHPELYGVAYVTDAAYTAATV